MIAQGNVEVWLGSLMTMAQKSLHNVIRQAHFAIGDANFQLLEFLNTFPAQVSAACRLFAVFFAFAKQQFSERVSLVICVLVFSRLVCLGFK